MSKFIENSDNNIPVIPHKEAFYTDLRKELSRISRYGHRASFMLIQLHISHEISADYLTNLYQIIKKQLRDCDSLYFFSPPCTFMAILPDTHEGGGECAALRLKRIISQIEGPDAMPIATSIGLVSMGQETLQDPETLLTALKNDLDRDNTCQALPKSTPLPERTAQIALLPENLVGQEEIREKIEPFCIIIPFNPKEGTLKHATDKAWCVAVFNKNNYLRNGLDILKFTQNNKGLKKIYKIFLGRPDDISSDFDLVLPATCDPDFLSYSILKAFNILKRAEGSAAGSDKYTQILSSISAATHQLNQPLQIILGKIELLMLDLDSDRTQTESIKKILSEIRNQVLYSADINQKINRLTKV